MEVLCEDSLTGASEYLEVSSERVSQLLTQVCKLFGSREEETELEVDGEVVWVAGSNCPDVEVRSLALSKIVLRRSAATLLKRVLVVARNKRFHYQLPAWAWEDRVVVSAVVAQDSLALQKCNLSLRNDCGVALEAIKHDARALQYAGEVPRNDCDVVLEAVKRDACALQYACEVPRDDREVVLTAVKQQGASLQYAGGVRCNDLEVVLEAVKRDACALQYACETPRNDCEVLFEAVKQNGRTLQYAGAVPRNDRGGRASHDAEREEREGEAEGAGRRSDSAIRRCRRRDPRAVARVSATSGAHMRGEEKTVQVPGQPGQGASAVLRRRSEGERDDGRTIGIGCGGEAGGKDHLAG